MKLSKLKTLFVDAQKAHRDSSAGLKDVTLQSNATRKELKEKKRALAVVRKDYKATRKLYRGLEKSVKEARAKHLQNNKQLEKISKKLARATSESKAKKASPAPAKKAARSAAHKKRKIEPGAAPLVIVS